MHALICYPHFSKVGQRKISALHDKYEPVDITPHFTLVHPTHLDLDTLQAHCTPIIEMLPKITFTLRCAHVVQNHFSQLWQLFLVPDQGFSQILKLHDKLYTGPLSADLRLDIPYIPHVRIGTFANASDAKTVADELNAYNLMISGTLTQVEFVDASSPFPTLATASMVTPK